MKEVYESAGEAAEAINVDRRTVQNWIKRGLLPVAPATERSGKRGRPGHLIKHSDLVEANRKTSWGDPAGSQLQLGANGTGPIDPLGLHVVWPMERRQELFEPSLLTGFTQFRAVTYSASLGMIFKLLIEGDYEDFEVIFGSDKIAAASVEEMEVELNGDRGPDKWFDEMLKVCDADDWRMRMMDHRRGRTAWAENVYLAEGPFDWRTFRNRE